MTIAWDTLIANSTIAPANIAWDHLNAQGGGGGTTVFINGLEVEVDQTALVATVDMAGISVILSPQDVEVTVDSGIQVVLDDQQIVTEIDNSLDVTLGCD